MSLSRRQEHQLRHIEARLFRSDPKLAGMLGVFGRLSAGQALPSWERVPTRPDRIRQAAALLAEALTIVATTTRLLLRALRLLLSAIRALAAAVARGGRARPPTRQLGRPNPAGWS